MNADSNIRKKLQSCQENGDGNVRQALSWLRDVKRMVIAKYYRNYFPQGRQDIGDGKRKHHHHNHIIVVEIHHRAAVVSCCQAKASACRLQVSLSSAVNML